MARKIVDRPDGLLAEWPDSSSQSASLLPNDKLMFHDRLLLSTMSGPCNTQASCGGRTGLQKHKRRNRAVDNGVTFSYLVQLLAVPYRSSSYCND